MKKTFYLITALAGLLFVATSVKAQYGYGFNSADPNIVFTGGNNPAAPDWSNYYKILKWGHTNRLGWNPYNYGYKCYWHRGMVFRVKFPKSYQQGVQDGKKYPMFMFFHGMGERGSIYDNEYQLLHGGQLHAQKVDAGDFDGFLIYPQSTDGSFQGYFPAMNSFIDSLVAGAKADEDRLIVSGLSAGSQSNYEYIYQNPKRVASLIIISAAATTYYSQLSTYLTVPVWITNGGRDGNPAAGIVTTLVDSFRNMGGKIIQKLYPTMGHGVWNVFWNEPVYFPYLPQQHKANPLVYYQHSEFCSNEPVNARLALQPGFYDYEWDKNGILISGANNNEYIATDYGTYRGRFKRTSTSEWSAWSPTPVMVTIKQATVTPPITINGSYSNVLPSPDGRNTVPLMVPSGYASYEWRKISDNSLVSDTSVYNAPIGQYKVKVNEQFGCSSDFSPIFNVISANGQNGPDKANNLTALTLSNSTIQLDWNDNPTPAFNETTFEIYRSKTRGSGYQLAGRVGADVLQYIDEGLSASTKYYYIVRAVNNNGAAEVSNEASATTFGDNTAPNTPQNLRVTSSSATTINLGWDPSSDDVGVFKYDVYVNGVKSYITNNNFVTTANLIANQYYSFYVVARDEAGNSSVPTDQIVGLTKQSGLIYKYYEGTYSTLPNFNGLTPVKTGTVPNVTISPRNRDDNFAFMWDGYINIPVDATYQFETYSDDGSRLYIDREYTGTGTVATVNNDGLHGPQYASGTVHLTAGVHRFIATFFEQGGGELMQVFWKSPTAGINERTLIPDSAFRLIVPGIAANYPAAPSNLFATASATNKLVLSWTDNSNNESGFQLLRGSSMAGPYYPAGTTAANITSFTDSIGLIAGKKYWYKVRAQNNYGVSALINNFEGSWTFNNNYSDESGAANNLAGYGLPKFNTAAAEGTHALQLNGNNQYVSVPNNAVTHFPANTYSSRTIGVWVNPTSSAIAGTNNVVVDFGGKDNGMAIRFNSGSLQAAIAGNNVRKTLTVSNIISNANWISGNWNHITLVYTAPTITLYVNGISVGTTTHTISTIFNSTNPSAFGASRGQNAFNSAASSSYFAGFIDHVTVVKEAIATSLVPSFVKSCLQSDTTLSLTPKPAAPSNLVINGENTTSIAMSFNDNSGNETGFEIFRSVGDNSNYRYIKTLPANATAIVNYTDDELFANTIYYYIIRAINNGGNSAFTSEATTKTHNNMPNFNALPADSFVMHYSTTENLNIGATDLDGETLTLTVITTLPPFVSFNQTGNGTGQFTFINPDILQQGDFPMQVVVEDENTGTDTLNFILVVNDNNKPVPNSVTDVSLAEGAVLNVPVSATDAQGNTGLVWSVQSSPSFVSVNNGVDGNATVVLAPGFSFEGVHSIVLKVTDAGGAYSLLSFNATVTHAEPVSEVVYMNMENAAPVANAPWNNITNVVSTNLLNAVGANTGIGLNFSTGWWSTSGQGSITGDNSGVYPDNVIQDFFYGGVYGSPDTISITLTGLTVGTRYNVTMFGSSSWANFTNNGTTLYEYNGQSKSIDVQGNKNKTVSFGSVAPNGSGQLVLRMYKAPGSPIAVLNAMVLEKLVNDLSLPAMPENLVGEALSDAKVELSWKDKSYNENNFQVYRATNPAGPYILLNTGATNANDSVYVDNSTSSQTTYYYKIEATNDNGSSGLTNFVEVKSTNRLPVLQTINDIVVQGGGSANVNISGTDPGDVLNLSVSGLPSFAVFTPTGNGTGSISINPGTNDVGTYNNISVILTDNNAGKTEETFSIIVTDPSVRNVYINFGPQGSPAAHTPWNNVLTYPFTNYVVSNLIDDANTNSGFSIRLVDGWEGNQSAGMYTGYNSGIYPDNVMQSSIHVTDALEHNIEISGLNPSMRYNIVGFSSHDAGISSSMTMKSGASSVVLEGMYNDVKSVQINNLTPNGSGVLTVSFKKTTSDLRYLNLNALIIQEVDPAFISSSIVRPFNLMAETLLDSTQIKLTWSDQSSNEAGFELYRATSQYGSYSLIATLSAGVTTYTNTGLSPNVRYFYKIRSYRGSGLSRRNSDYSNIATEVLSPRIVYININVESAMNASAPWNNLNSPAVEGATFPDLNDNKTFNSGVEMEITKEFNGTGYGGVNSNSGIFPSLVMQSNYWSDANQLSQVKFKNLNINKRYRIGIFGSAIFFGYAIANYTCNGHTVQLNSYNNSTKIVYLDNLQPDDNGELVLSVITAPDQPYTFTGAFTIESYNAYDNYTPISTNKQADETEPASENAPGEIINNANSNQHPVAQVEKGMQQTVAIKEDKGAINVYPNPFTNKIEVEVNEVKADNISILLYDVNARLIYKSTPFKPISGRNVIQVNLPGGVSLTPGNYVLNVLFDGKPAKTVKLVKIR